MATINDIRNGIEIISKYIDEDELNGHNFQAEHDQIWCGEYTGEKMTPTDLEAMKEFGWFEDEDSWSRFA